MIGTKMKFKDEENKGITPYEFLGVICDYNGINIKQTLLYIDVSSETYINHSTKLHDWDITTPSCSS